MNTKWQIVRKPRRDNPLEGYILEMQTNVNSRWRLYDHSWGPGSWWALSYALRVSAFPNTLLDNTRTGGYSELFISEFKMPSVPESPTKEEDYLKSVCARADAAKKKLEQQIRLIKA